MPMHPSVGHHTPLIGTASASDPSHPPAMPRTPSLLLRRRTRGLCAGTTAEHGAAELRSSLQPIATLLGVKQITDWSDLRK
jgi:hypothetical protein